jgi:hypothetical protein
MASITIPLYYDLDLLLWTSAAGGIARQPNLVLGQSDSIDFAVQFVRSGAVIELTSPAWICGIKPINDTAGDYLCQTTTGVKTGSTTTTVYTFTLLLDSTELRAWLLTVTAVSNYAAFSIRDTVNLIATLPAITCTILPDYTLAGTTPTAASGTLIVASGQTFTVNKSFAMPTTDGFSNYVLKTNGAGVGSWAVDSAGTGTVQSVSVTTANGVSGTVATSTTTPAITIALGAITPATGAFSDNTDATSSTSAPLKTAGGMAVAKTLYVGDHIQVDGASSRSSFANEVLVAGNLLVSNFASFANDPTLLLSPIASSVNYVTIEPSVTGSPVHIYAQGGDDNIGLHLQAKGTGFVNVQDGTDTTKRLRFGASGNGTGITTTLATSSTTSQTITLPNATGATTLAGLQMTQAFTQVNTFSSATPSTTIGSGAVVISAGGLGVFGNAYIGGVINLPATTATAGQITQAGERFIHTFTPGVQNQNVFIGFQSGRTSTMTGGGNVGIGRAVLQGLTSGSNNLCFGDGVAYAVTSGSSNVMIGQASANNLTTGSNNVGCGVNSLKLLVSGQSNAAMGYGSLEACTGSNSTGAGFNSGQSATGNNNAFFGHTAGNATATVGGLGGLAITTGTNNTMLGQASSSTSATGTYRTAIGSDSRCESNNAIKLGRDTLDVVLLPKMTEAQLATAATTLGAIKGALAYCTDGAQSDHVFFYNGSSWARIN